MILVTLLQQLMTHQVVALKHIYGQHLGSQVSEMVQPRAILSQLENLQLVILLHVLLEAMLLRLKVYI